MTHFYIFFNGADYYATPHKERAESWPGGIVCEGDANLEDDQSLAALADLVATYVPGLNVIQFSW